MKEGTFFVLSGPSGSGKGTVLKEVLKLHKNIKYSISATTRLPRDKEKDGVNYFFKSQEEFENLIREDAFLEYTKTYGNYYGTLKSQVGNAIKNGDNIILEIDPVGAKNIRFAYPKAVLIFLVAPSINVLKKRLSGRGSEDDNSFNNRFGCALQELENATFYDYIIVNHTIEQAAQDISSIIKAESLKVEKNLNLIKDFKGGMDL